jgi:hemoglobin
MGFRRIAADLPAGVPSERTGHPDGGPRRSGSAGHDHAQRRTDPHPRTTSTGPATRERLAAYWAEALGGPTTYSDSYGDETSVVRIHSGNGRHEELDRRAIACFDQALDDAELTVAEPLRQVLHDYFAWATTTTMARYHESDDDVPARAGPAQYSTR